MKIRIQSFGFMALVASSLALSGCAETQLASTWVKQVNWPGQQQAQGTYKVGNPYKVGSVWYYPEENFNLVETGIASWYGPGFHEDHTANGEVFDQNQLTAAHRTLQLPCFARVTNLENGHSVVVRINDRGPYLHGRIMDVSMRAAELLGFASKGTARVKLEVLEKESRTLAEAGKRGEDTSHMTLADVQKIAGMTGLATTAQPTSPQPPVITPAPAFAPVRPVAAAAPQPAVRMASAATGTEDDSMPESLRTPTITVEELAAPGSHATVPPPHFSEHPQQAAYQPPAVAPSSGGRASGSMAQGHVQDVSVVSKEPVHPTGIFVQAGSFSVFANAEKLTRSLANIAPTTIEPVTVNGHKLYRVKLGPIATETEADNILEKVISSNGNGAKVIKD
jgi:rare lipoprotein A